MPGGPCSGQPALHRCAFEAKPNPHPHSHPHPWCQVGHAVVSRACASVQAAFEAELQSIKAKLEERRSRVAEMEAAEGSARGAVARHEEPAALGKPAVPTGSCSWRSMLATWAQEVRKVLLPRVGAKLGELRRQMELLPSSFNGELMSIVADAVGHSQPGPELDRFAISYLRQLGETLEQVGFACSTGKCSDCALCQDVCISPATAKALAATARGSSYIHAKEGGEGGALGLQALCLWRFGVCGAAAAAGSRCPPCWTHHGGDGEPKTLTVALHNLCLQPLPAFMWLGLEEDADAPAVANAFRRLSRVHHPDRGGGDLNSWELTKQCHSLLRDQCQLEAYLLGRNHAEFVRQQAQWGTELSTREKVQAMQAARLTAQERQQQGNKSAAKSASGKRIWADERETGGSSNTATQRRHQAGPAEMRQLQDLDALIPQMPNPSIRLVEAVEAAHGRKGHADLMVEWPKRLGRRMISEEGGRYCLQYQKQVGPKTSDWQTIYTGRNTAHTHSVVDTDREYVSEHYFRVAALTDSWESQYSYPVSISVNLQDEAGSEVAVKKFERRCHAAQLALGQCRQGDLNLEGMCRLASSLTYLLKQVSSGGGSLPSSAKVHVRPVA